MLSGKNMYYNSIKADNNISDSCVTMANGPRPTTVLGKIHFHSFSSFVSILISLLAFILG